MRAAASQAANRRFVQLPAGSSRGPLGPVAIEASGWRGPIGAGVRSTMVVRLGRASAAGGVVVVGMKGRRTATARAGHQMAWRGAALAPRVKRRAIQTAPARAADCQRVLRMAASTAFI